jgi:general secretion pathway protein H
LVRAHSSARRPGHTAGFTLIEILVVMVIIAIVLGVVSVNFSSDDKRILRTEAERLALLLEHAQDEATITGRSVAWSANGSQYQFWQLSADGNWVPLSGDELLRVRTFGPLVEFRGLKLNQTDAKPDERLVFAPGGTSVPFALTLGLRDELIVVSGDAAGRVRVGG